MNQKYKAPLLCALFLLSNIFPAPLAYADGLNLPKPGERVLLSPVQVPPILKAIKVHPENPFRIDFILDKGHLGPRAEDTVLREQMRRLIDYFLASLTIPEQDMWVNLSPYERDRIVPDNFSKTAMGRDLLAQDYILKEITASLIHPDERIGKEFWNGIYTEAQRRFGTTHIPVNTLNKVWIVPEKVVVEEHAGSAAAIIKESRLNVLLEEDYFALSKKRFAQAEKSQAATKHGAQMAREIVLPALIKEVNQGSNFSLLRQVYHSFILAAWYKRKIKDSLLASHYVNHSKLSGITIDDPNIREALYQRYIQAFKIGVFNMVREERDENSGRVVPRKYFAGGVQLPKDLDKAMVISRGTELPWFDPDMAMEVAVTLRPDQAMSSQAKLTKMYTHPGRLDRSTDALGVMAHVLAYQKPSVTIYDIGIGWDDGPTTVSELAESVKNQTQVHVVGIDYVIPKYQVATFYGEVLFNEMGDIISWKDLNGEFHPGDQIDDQHRRIFKEIFNKVVIEGQPDPQVKVISDPIRIHQRPNLEFVQTDMFHINHNAHKVLSQRKADIVRIANVIIPHYGPQHVADALKALSPYINEGGKVLIGHTGAFQGFRHEDFLVYVKEQGNFYLRQYAFTTNPHVDWSLEQEENNMKKVLRHFQFMIGQSVLLHPIAAFSYGMAWGPIVIAKHLKKEGYQAQAIGQMVFLDFESLSRASASTEAFKIWTSIYRKYRLDLMPTVVELPAAVDFAQTAEENLGGIDLTVRPTFEAADSRPVTSFSSNALKEQLRDFSGFTPYILNMKPLTDLRAFITSQS